MRGGGNPFNLKRGDPVTDLRERVSNGRDG